MSAAGGGRRPARRVVVTGVGLVSAVGDSLPELRGALASGRSGIAEITGFDPSGLSCRNGGEIVGFDPARDLGRANFRPLDRTGRLVTVAAARALDDGGLPRRRVGDQEGSEGGDRGEEGDGAGRSPEIGLVLGTMFGSVHTISAFDRRGLEAGPKYTKPLDFANSVINAAAGQAAIWHGLTGVNATVSGGTTAGLQAFGYAADLVASGRADAVLAGGADELCYESFLGFVRGGWAAPAPRPDAVPFHARRQGFMPAEGAALLLLEPEEAARARGARILAEVRGHATLFDPSRGRDSERAVAAVARAVRQALAGSVSEGTAKDDADGVACLSASASGRPDGDRVEARGVAAVLGERATDVPVVAVKGVLGEALGASGAFQVLAALAALGTGEVPGIPGLDALGADIPLAAAGASSRRIDGGAALMTAVGLDGNASALVLTAGEDLGAALEEARS